MVNFFTDGNYNNTRILGVKAAPGALGASGVSLVSPAVTSSLTTQSPGSKIAVGATWAPNNDWEVTLRETRYGSTLGYVDPVGNGRNFYITKVYPAIITDLNVKYNITERYSIQLGANNLFNIEPTPTYPLALRNDANWKYPVFSPFGINGGYYFARLSVKL